MTRCQGDGSGCGVQRITGRHKRITLVWYHGIVDIQCQVYTLIFLDVEIYLRVGTVGCRIDITFQRQELESDGIASHLLADIDNCLAGIGDVAHTKVELESHRRIRCSVELGKRIKLEVDRRSGRYTEHLDTVFSSYPSVIYETEIRPGTRHLGIVSLCVINLSRVLLGIVAHLWIEQECSSSGRRLCDLPSFRRRHTSAR